MLRQIDLAVRLAEPLGLQTFYGNPLSECAD